MTPTAEVSGRVESCPGLPCVAKLMALEIRRESFVRGGQVAGYADLARLGQVTRARMTQIVNLPCLAPDIRGEVLFLTTG